MSSISEVLALANGRWPQVLSSLGIQVNEKGTHSPCPACGGKDRFRFDDLDGRGTWFCNQCVPQSGDGLNLVSNALGLTAFEATQKVSELVGQNNLNIPSIISPKDCLNSKQVEAAKKANNLLRLTISGASPYMVKKSLSQKVPVFSTDPNIKIGNIPFKANDICLPIFDGQRNLVNCQLINGEGEKRFLYGGKKSGCFHVIEGDGGLIAIAEGYATGLTIHLATNATTYIAFDCGNLKKVAIEAKGRHPRARIIVCGDNDLSNQSNVGKVKAELAAEEISAEVRTPEIDGDWNDFYQQYGIDETQKHLLSSELAHESEQRVNNKKLEPWEIEALAKIGSNHAHIVVGARHKVMLWKHCPVDGVRPTFESISEFQNYFLHLPSIAGINQGKAWMSWEGKVFYPNGIGYFPDVHNLPCGCFNLFTGWGAEPINSKGLDEDSDLTLIKTHLKEIICDDCEESYSYLIGWLAQMVQHPEEKPPVAILLKSVEGTGKGTFYELLKAVLGKNAYQVNGNGQLVGRFNSIIDGRLLVFGDEVDMTDKRQYDKLKSLISEKTQSVERKGLEPEPVRVLARFIFTGNHDHLIKAGTNERRWLVLEPSAKNQDNSTYWDNLYKSLRGTAPAKFLYCLLNKDLSNFNIRKPPVTQGLIEQKLASLKLQETWMYEQLSSDKPFNGQSRITTSDAISLFVDFSERLNEPKTIPQARSLVGKIMSAAGMEVMGRSDRGDGIRFYDIPPLADMREAFSAYLRHKSSDIF